MFHNVKDIKGKKGKERFNFLKKLKKKNDKTNWYFNL